MKRNHTIDIMRGIAIYLVVFGHVTHIPELRTYIWGFHIPVFFFLSGLLFKREHFDGFASFFKSRLKSIVIPYVIFYLVTFAYWIIIERHSRGTDVSPLSQIEGLLYGTYDLRYMMFNGALWFIPCLFSMEMIYWFISLPRNKAVRLGGVFLLYIIGVTFKVSIGWLPWGICAAMIAMPYYALGDLCKPLLLDNHCCDYRKWYVLIIIAGLITLQIVVLPWTGADLASLRITNVWLYIPISLLGIAVCYLLSAVIAKSSVLEFLGINSLVIFAFQEPVYRAVIFVTSKLLRMPVETARSSIPICLVVAIVSIVVIIPAIYCWNRWCRPAIRRL